MVTGSVNGLVKKDYAVRDAVEVMGADGKAIIVKYISLTEAGLGFNPDACSREVFSLIDAIQKRGQMDSLSDPLSNLRQIASQIHNHKKFKEHLI